MNNLNHLGLFVGTSQCNAFCAHCAGVPLRRWAPMEDGNVDEDLIERTLRDCYAQGARSLSLSSSGEPTLSPISVTRVLELVHACRMDGIEYEPVNLYSNGIRIGEDNEFCGNYLPLWKHYGLCNMYITVHSVDEAENAKAYGISYYPSLEVVISRIHDAGLVMRANIVLSNSTIGNLENFVSAIESLKQKGADYAAAWPIRDMDDLVDAKLAPLEAELEKMEEWVNAHQEGKFRIRVIRDQSHDQYSSGEKLTLFPDGTLSGSWCNH